jgi:hypothetical protein
MNVALIRMLSGYCVSPIIAMTSATRSFEAPPIGYQVGLDNLRKHLAFHQIVVVHVDVGIHTKVRVTHELSLMNVSAFESMGKAVSRCFLLCRPTLSVTVLGCEFCEYSVEYEKVEAVS